MGENARREGSELTPVVPFSNPVLDLPQRVKKRGVALRGQLENVAHLFYFETKRVDISPAQLGPCGQFGLDLNRLSYRVGGYLPVRLPLIPGVNFFANSLSASLQLPPQILSTIHNGLVKFDDVLCAMAAEMFEQLYKAYVIATGFERGCKPTRTSISRTSPAAFLVGFSPLIRRLPAFSWSRIGACGGLSTTDASA
jgi:hypothetical protein